MTQLAECDQEGLDLYTAEQRRRRDETPWTVVQGILAPLQFLIFLIKVLCIY